MGNKMRSGFKPRLAAVALAGTAALALIAGCASSGGSGGGAGNGGGNSDGGNGKLTKVTIATPGNSAAAAFAYVAQDAGFFKQNGLDVTLNTSVAPASTPAALVRGSVQVSALTGTATSAHQSGLPLVNIVQTSNRAPFVMLGAPGITDLSQLGGKTVVTSPIFGSLGASSNYVLSKAGLIGKVKLVQLDSVPAKSALFTAGKADAIFEALNNAMDDQTKRPGSTIISDAESLPLVPMNGFAVTESFVKDHPDTVRALAKSALQATNLMKNNQTEAASLIAKEFHLSADNAKKFLETQAPTLDLSGAPTEQAFQNQADLFNSQPAAPGTKKVTWTAQMVAETWDTSIATQAAKGLGYGS